MTEAQADSQHAEDGRHDFRSATVRADNDEIVDDEGHEFTKGRIADRDEEDDR